MVGLRSKLREKQALKLYTITLKLLICTNVRTDVRTDVRRTSDGRPYGRLSDILDSNGRPTDSDGRLTNVRRTSVGWRFFNVLVER